MRKTLHALTALVLFAPASAWAQQRDFRVVTTIRPLHSLASYVMNGSGDSPELLVKGSASPHDFSLKPSQAEQLRKADIIFYISDRLESFMPGVLESVRGPEVVQMAAQPGMLLLPVRRDLPPEPAKEDSRNRYSSNYAGDRTIRRNYRGKGLGNYNYDPQKAFAEFARNPERSVEENPLHAGEEEAHAHDHDLDDGYDPHLWMDPMNAVTMLDIIAERLSTLNPGKEHIYRRNAEDARDVLLRLERRTREQLERVQGIQFIVFHDAFQYFENAYGIGPARPLSLNPEFGAGAKRVSDARRMLLENDDICIFYEPQYDKALIQRLVAGSRARTTELDPLGTNIDLGKSNFFLTMEDLSDRIYRCLR